MLTLLATKFSGLCGRDLKESLCRVREALQTDCRHWLGAMSAISLMAPGCRHRCLALGTRLALPTPTATDCVLKFTTVCAMKTSFYHLQACSLPFPSIKSRHDAKRRSSDVNLESTFLPTAID